MLVHCYAGQSRSVALVLAYLLAARGMSLSEAWQAVRAARPGAKPNSGFMQQLAGYAAQVGSPMAPQTPTPLQQQNPAVDELPHMELPPIEMLTV